MVIFKANKYVQVIIYASKHQFLRRPQCPMPRSNCAICLLNLKCSNSIPDIMTFPAVFCRIFAADSFRVGILRVGHWCHKSLFYA